MWISEIFIEHCRNIESTNLELSPEVNFFYGSNGSGKTSFLEALSLLSLGRSFRTARITDVIQHNHEAVLVSARGVADKHKKQAQRMGVKKSPDKTHIRFNGQTLRTQSELTRVLPLTLIHPQSNEIITGGSAKRRSFLDWIAFYQFPEFHSLWKKYQIVLKQRNASLKNPRMRYALEALTAELCQLQPALHNFRRQTLELLKDTIEESIPDFLQPFKPKLKLKSGFPEDVVINNDELVEYYLRKVDVDIRYGRTVRGIHTADLHLELGGMRASTSASRGQIKIMALLLLISQSLTINEVGIIAVDDLHAEIDNNNYQKLLSFICSLSRQVFITSTKKPCINTLDVQKKMFHVKQGQIIHV